MSRDYGELTIRELVELGGQAITPERVEANEAYKQKQKLLNADKRQFTKVNERECSLIVNTLTLTQAGTLLSMFAYMELGESGLLYHNGKELSIKDFSKLTNKSERALQRSISELVNLGYVTAHKSGRSTYYSINTQIANRGKSQGEGFFSRLFVTQLREVIKGATLQELGLFLHLLPHFNTRAYVISKNPHELELNKIELLNREKIAELTGLSLPTVKRLIPSMMRKGLLTGVKTWRTAIILHPRLVSRQLKKVTLEDVTDIIENELNKKKEW
ncbi:helix-turn-helix domain-containing protein [Salipaludibacillus sp. CUR1]|uniref:helix-turn-helix domain-containing protein n=1 Tax=Salipaludibacillus sp. CUR1 TaxID=2820003 RepID=UPI001E56C46C|nr:helix-turn-helix domain-containing protein [Salipaludibacillus sp. CUR1]MCE7792302.1 helix-turn-helix domain-containing protein [Salipaludibacillus sp. CUR1]